MSNIHISWDSERVDHKFLADLENIKLDLMKICLADIAPYEYKEPDAEHANMIRYKNNIVPGIVPGSPSNISIGATAMLMMSYGEFPIPPEIMKYIKEEYDNDRVNKKKFPQTEEAYERGKTLIDAFMARGIPYYAACAMSGACWVECGWNVHVANDDEKAFNGVADTGGWPGCGEGLFGLTFWSQKQKIIKKMNLPGIPMDITMDQYERANTHLCDLDEETWVDILKTYLEICVPKQQEVLCREDDPEDDEQRTEVLCASYLFKAGGGVDPTFENAKETTERYMRTHTAQAAAKALRAGKTSTYNAYNGFALQIFIGILLDRYLHDEDLELVDLETGVDDIDDGIKDSSSIGTNAFSTEFSNKMKKQASRLSGRRAAVGSLKDKKLKKS